jgi:hypothetical membrane protein
VREACVKFLALGGVAGPALFSAVVILCGVLRPDYSHAAQFISELGANGTQNAALMNFAGFVPSGLLIAALGVSLSRLLPRVRISIVAAALTAMFGFGLAIAGLYPCEPGCPQQELTLHDGVSMAAFLSGIAGSAVFARIFRSCGGSRALWLYSAVSSAGALCFLVALASSLESRALTGLWQRLLVGTLFLWCAVVGLHFFRSSGPPSHAA